ncbi:MAG: hypothetical protein KatS3mg105_4636 [Gemmatales bacterium]|nr:MAG: hypothetical protein KatS3mg105_4636 [Gemmatales bacterium]
MNKRPANVGPTSRHDRVGFTLIEMLVVLGIFLALSGMMFYLASVVRNKDKATQGASELQSWLKIAQMWALRDQRATGLRLILDPGRQYVTQCVYIAQPDPYVGAPGATLTTTQVSPTLVTVTGSGIDFSGGFGGSPSPQWPVQTGDYLELGSGATARLYRLTPVSPTQLQIQIDPAEPWTDFTTSDFRIIRRPRPRQGEPALNLPYHVVVDLSTNGTFGGGLPFNAGTPYVDIVFGPSGRLVGEGLPASDIMLWVRDTSEDNEPGLAGPNEFRLSPMLVVVSVRTGMVSVQPVSHPPYNDPYALTRDGRASGSN